MDYIKLNSTLHFPEDPYFICLLNNMPFPKLDTFTKPYDILNKCKATLTKNIVDYINWNKLA